MKFRHLKKIIFFGIFLLWDRVKLNFRDRYGKPNIYSKNSSCDQVFSSNSQKLSLWCKNKNHYPCRWICMTHIKAPTLFPREIIIFQGVLTKFNFCRNFHIWEKIVDLMKALKYEHQSILPLWGRVKLNFRDRYGKPNIYFNNSSCYQFFSSNSQKLSLWCKKKIIPHPYGFV